MTTQEYIKIELIFIVFAVLFITACKTTAEENTSSDASVYSVDANSSIKEKYEIWMKGVDLLGVNIDSLWEAEGKDKGYSLEKFREFASTYSEQFTWRWTEQGFMAFSNPNYKQKLGNYIWNANTVTIHPNPTSASATVTLFKNSWCYEHSKLEKLFPFEVSFKLIFDENIVWTYHNSSSYGTETISESVLQRAGNYRLVVNVDGNEEIANFMVIKR